MGHLLAFFKCKKEMNTINLSDDQNIKNFNTNINFVFRKCILNNMQIVWYRLITTYFFSRLLEIRFSLLLR